MRDAATEAIFTTPRLLDKPTKNVSRPISSASLPLLLILFSPLFFFSFFSLFLFFLRTNFEMKQAGASRPNRH